MEDKNLLTVIGELAIFATLAYFTYKQTHSWALSAAIALIGIMLMGVQQACRNIIQRLSILYDEVKKAQ